MTELSQKMRQLVEPWQLEVTVDGQAREQEFPPLVDMLQGQLVPGMEGGAGGGMPSTRNVLDVKSLDLLMNMQDVIRAWLCEWGVSSVRELKADLRVFWTHLHALYHRGDIDETTFERLAAYPDAWAVRVWDLIEPPRAVPLRRTECPRCGETKTINGDGEASDNLLVTFRVGHEVTAECRNPECAAVWIGRDALVELGRATGSAIDIDTLMEAVAQMS